jgi:hypothetical protein
MPIGIPAEVNPKKIGMLEQEQKGVTAPNVDPMRYPKNLLFLAR